MDIDTDSIAKTCPENLILCFQVEGKQYSYMAAFGTGTIADISSGRKLTLNSGNGRLGPM
jgi:hypothetical protein